MTLTIERVSHLVGAQVALIRDSLVKAGLLEVLVSPQEHLRIWNYGRPGEQLPCWTVGLHRPSQTCFLYSEHGFGPKSPWGMGIVGDGHFGMDSSWYPNLRDCYLESFAPTDLPIWQVVAYPWSTEAQVLHRDLEYDEANRIRDAIAVPSDPRRLTVLARPDGPGDTT